MTLQASGAIDAGDINVELLRARTDPFDINGSLERYLAGVPSGAISFSDFYGKTYVPNINWADISASGTGTITGTNANKTIPIGGTLTFSTTFAGTYKVFKNNVDQGMVASLAVIAGDAVHFSATASPGAGAIMEGTFTVSGPDTGGFSISIRDTSGA